MSKVATVTKPTGRLVKQHHGSEYDTTRTTKHNSKVPRANSLKEPKGTRTPKEPASQAGSIVPHSGHQWEISNHYHKHTVNTRSPERVVDELNPTSAVPPHRSYPGLAN